MGKKDKKKQIQTESGKEEKDITITEEEKEVKENKNTNKNETKEVKEIKETPKKKKDTKKESTAKEEKIEKEEEKEEKNIDTSVGEPNDTIMWGCVIGFVLFFEVFLF